MLNLLILIGRFAESCTLYFYSYNYRLQLDECFESIPDPSLL